MAYFPLWSASSGSTSTTFSTNSASLASVGKCEVTYYTHHNAVSVMTPVMTLVECVSNCYTTIPLILLKDNDILELAHT